MPQPPLAPRDIGVGDASYRRFEQPYQPEKKTAGGKAKPSGRGCFKRDGSYRQEAGLLQGQRPFSGYGKTNAKNHGLNMEQIVLGDAGGSGETYGGSNPGRPPDGLGGKPLRGLGVRTLVRFIWSFKS